MNLTTNPLISVVMPVHNARPFPDESINSILEQTLSAFEFVIFDDASTDGSVELLREWSRRDGRIHLHEGNKRLGLSGSSNAVVAKARAPIVARMDADDIAHPDRLRRQWHVIESRPDVAVIGTLCNGIDRSGREVRPRDRWRLVRRSVYIPFPHGSAMFRREVFDQVGGYDETSGGGEDQDLFLRMATRGRVVTLPDVLYSYRYHSSNATLLNGTRAVGQNHSRNGDALAAFYMLGAMRLWAGNAGEKVIEVERQDINDPGFRDFGSCQPANFENFPALIDPCPRSSCQRASKRRETLRMAIKIVFVGCDD